MDLYQEAVNCGISYSQYFIDYTAHTHNIIFCAIVQEVKVIAVATGTTSFVPTSLFVFLLCVYTYYNCVLTC